MDLSITLEPNRPISELIKTVQVAESLGFSKCWVADEGIVNRDIFITLALLAEHTQRIKLGTGITNPYIRHPGITAAAIATLNELSNGRIFMGISAGGTITLNPLGLKHKKPLTAVREMVMSSRSLFQGNNLSVEGELFSFQNATISFAQNNIDIWIAARGQKMLFLAGEIADGVILGPLHRDLIDDYIGFVNQGMSLSGNKTKLCFTTSVVFEEKNLEEIRNHMSFNLIDSPPKVKELLGITPEMVDKVRFILVNEGPDKAGKLIPIDWILPFVIMGTETECKQQITEIQSKYGIDDFRIQLSEGCSQISQLEKFADVFNLKKENNGD